MTFPSLKNTILKSPAPCVQYLWWRGERRPPRRSGSCGDSVSSATYRRPAGSIAPLVCISWRALGWCGTQWRPLLAGSMEQGNILNNLSAY